MLFAFWQSQIISRICKGVFCWCGSCLPKIPRELAYFCQFEEWMLGFFPSSLFTDFFFFFLSHSYVPFTVLDFFLFCFGCFFYFFLLGFHLTHRYLTHYKFQNEALAGLKWTSGRHLLIFLYFYSCLQTSIFKDCFPVSFFFQIFVSLSFLNLSPLNILFPRIRLSNDFWVRVSNKSSVWYLLLFHFAYHGFLQGQAAACTLSIDKAGSVEFQWRAVIFFLLFFQLCSRVS